MQKPRRLRQQTRGTANLRKQADVAQHSSLRDRLFSRLVATDPPITHDRLGRPIVGSCLLWQGCTNEDGYGKIGSSELGGNKSVHRLALAFATGRDVDELDEVDHLCRVHHCAQATHLEETTHAENVRRGDVGRWFRGTHCPHGHLFDEANTRMNNGCRQCRTCDRIRAREKYQRQRRLGYSSSAQ
jgi:hypothetical protein